MSGEFVNPNWHVALIHYPLALLIVGVIMELLSHIWPAHRARVAARWMILVGSLSVIPTAMAGIYALRDVQVPGPVNPGLRWADAVASGGFGDEQWTFLRNHVIANLIAAACFLGVTIVWLAATDLWRKRLYWPFMLILIVGLGFADAGAWHGGEAVYRFGTGVMTHNAAAGVEGMTEGSAVGLKPPEQTIPAYFVPPLQLHMLLASMVFPFVLVGLALALRRWHEPATHVYDNETDNRATVTFAFPRRWWWLALASAVLAALAADWSFMGVFTMDALRENLEHLAVHTRLLAHVVFGVCVIVLLLILALTIRRARNHGGLFTTLVVLLFVASAIQVWLGILMLYDSHEGSLFHFGG